jgi:excisionase family DNA binding protein
MTDLLFTPIRLKELEALIENSVERAIKTLNQNQSLQSQADNPLSIKEASKLIGKTVPTLYGYCQRNEMPYHKNGNRLIFFKSELVEWIKQGKVKTLDELRAETDEYLSNKKRV